MEISPFQEIAEIGRLRLTKHPKVFFGDIETNNNDNNMQYI